MFDMHRQGKPAMRRREALPPPQWTPEAVEAELIEAMRWLRLAGGRAGGFGFAQARLPDRPLTPEEVIALTGAPPERADDPDEAREIEREQERLRFRMMPARRVTELEDALQWPARYLVRNGHQGSARCVGLWIVARSGGSGFAAAIKGAGIPRSMAYRLKDRGLSRISVALVEAGVPLRGA